jgi:cytochrome c biogenesis factor
MRRFLSLVLPLSLALVAVLAPAAIAHDAGQGLIGEANDKIITNAGFIVIAMFPLIILIASTIQWRLDKRKATRMAAKRHRSSGAAWRGGW